MLDSLGIQQADENHQPVEDDIRQPVVDEIRHLDLDKFLHLAEIIPSKIFPEILKHKFKIKRINLLVQHLIHSQHKRNNLEATSWTITSTTGLIPCTKSCATISAIVAA